LRSIGIVIGWSVNVSLRNQVFISYSHADAAWRDAFVTMLAPAIERRSISLWSDANIPVGENWSRQIDQALEMASAGILLVTPSFLSSEFVKSVELPRLLNLARAKGISIWWIPISPSLYLQTPLKDVQAAWDPDQPLERLPKARRNEAIQKICTQMVEDFGFLPKVSEGKRQRLSRQLEDRLGGRYFIEDEIAAGRFSILFRARQKNPARTVGIKLFVASEIDEWATCTFDQAVKEGADLSSSAFIRIFEHVVESPQFLVTEFVDAEPLNKYLQRYPEGVPLAIVRRILRDLLSAFIELHERGRVRGELCPSNILIQPSGNARIATVDFSAILSNESTMAGELRIDRESLAYMTPERFLGQPHTQLSDQFSLGLIAMELLGGERMPSVTCPRDLEGKWRIFQQLEESAGAWSRRSEGFSGLVSRLLRIDPGDRWDSMRDASEILQDIEIAESPQERFQRIARVSYVRLQSGGRDRAFFERFYESLFSACPDIKMHFDNVEMAKQKALLNKAIQLLIDFDPARGCEQLAKLAGTHSRFALTKKHYDHFLDALMQTIEQSGTKDPEELEAWRASISPPLEFMRTCQLVSGSTVGALE
jgi:serine/threonine protein kinase